MSGTYPAPYLFIGGRRLSGAGRASQALVNPATIDVLGTLPHANGDDIDAAIAAAAHAFPKWRATSPVERGALLRAAGARLREGCEALARLITLEMGKPLAEARREVETAAEMFEWAAEEGRRSYGRVIPPRSAGYRQFAVWEPVGPVAAFCGWNAAAITPARKIGGALAAGCSIVIKPSEQTPAAALFIAEALHAAGVPPGVVNVVFGDPARVAERLIASPQIRHVTFTGGTNVGRGIGALAATHLKGATLELGGHAPVIVFADADVEAVAEAAVRVKYRNAGQVCTSPTRFYVHESIHDRFAERFAKLASEIVVGDGLDEHVQMGPLANERRLLAMQQFTDDARARGIHIAAGGEREGARGWFWRPTLFVDVGIDCLAANVEPFGPIALTSRFSSFDEAVSLANRLPFGLAAYAFTSDAGTAARIGDAIASGSIAINHWQVSLPETPFGGFGDSGLGKEGGIEGLRAFQQLKYISQA